MKQQPIQITIPQPCSQDWNKMTPQEQGRFCDSCQKCVVDFTGFTDEELYQYIAGNAGKKTCGKFSATQLNRPIQLPPQPHSQLYKWMMAAGLVLVLSSVPEMKTFARVPFVTTVHDIDTFNPAGKEKKKDKSEANADSLTIKGYVTDQNNDPVFSAQVSIRRGEKILAGTISDSNGYFEIKLSATDTADANIFVHYIGLHEYMAALPAKGVSMNIKLEPTDATFGFFDIIILEHDPPLIDKFNGGHIKTIKSDEIEKSAY